MESADIILRVLWCYWVVVLVTGLDCREKAYDFNGQRCCSKCSPGYGMVSDCSHGNDTQCRPCLEGKTFSAPDWHTGKCQNCSECKKHSHVKEPCTSSHDTICECDVDFFYSYLAKECLLCNLCPIGYGAIIPCSGLQNSVCLKCPIGTYSDVKSATSPCKYCTKCTSRQVEIQPCKDTDDTICYDIPEDYTSQPTKAKENKDFDVIPIYCAILGAVVLGLLGYVIFKQYTRLKNRKIFKGHDLHEDVEYSKASGADSGVFVENEFINKQYNQLSRVRDIPLQKRKEIEKNLAIPRTKGDNWKLLARELGYEEEKIEQFECTSDDPVIQVQNMLNHWTKRKHATVGVFIKALTNLNRLDIVRILQNDITEIKTDNRLHHIV